MLFVLRVVLVVGVLSYLALLRDGADPAAEARKLATLPSHKDVVPPSRPWCLRKPANGWCAMSWRKV